MKTSKQLVQEAKVKLSGRSLSNLKGLIGSYHLTICTPFSSGMEKAIAEIDLKAVKELIKEREIV